VPAIDFYVKDRDPRFTYGDFHQQTPEKYVSEMLLGRRPATDRLWVVFSHIDLGEDQRILRDLSTEWNVEPVISVKGSALYLARRRVAVSDVISSRYGNHMIEAPKETAAADPVRDTRWAWNMRNCPRPVCSTSDRLHSEGRFENRR
jgi:hypothetical protein